MTWSVSGARLLSGPIAGTWLAALTWSVSGARLPSGSVAGTWSISFELLLSLTRAAAEILARLRILDVIAAVFPCRITVLVRHATAMFRVMVPVRPVDVRAVVTVVTVYVDVD